MAVGKVLSSRAFFEWPVGEMSKECVQSVETAWVKCRNSGPVGEVSKQGLRG